MIVHLIINVNIYNDQELYESNTVKIIKRLICLQVLKMPFLDTYFERKED